MNKNIIKISINQKIKELRLKNNLTQKEFSEKVGITRASLGQIETFVANPTLELIIRIVREFPISYDELIDDVSKSEEKDALQMLLIKQQNIHLEKEIDLKNEIIENQKSLIETLKNIQ